MALIGYGFLEQIKRALIKLKPFFVAFSLTFTLPLLGICQENLKGTVKATSGEIIPYANIIVTGKQGGTYSDEVGNFEINVMPFDSLTFSSIGYKRITLSVGDIKIGGNQIYLSSDITQLQTVTIESKKNRIKIERGEFGYTKTKRRSMISSGIPGTQFATFIMNNSEKQGFVEYFLLGITCERKSRIRIRLYRPTTRNGVGQETTKQNLLFDIIGNHKRYKLDVSMYQIPFEKEGIIVALEFLGEVGKDNKVKKGTTTGTKLYLTDGNDPHRNTWQSYRDSEFVRESFSDNQRNTSNALIGLLAIFYLDTE